MKKKVVILGGGTGLSTALKGLKTLPIDLTAVVTVSDNGSSTGKLRKDFYIPAVGDIRKVLSSLSTLPEDIQDLMEYRITINPDKSKHAIGNLLLTCLLQKTKSLKQSIESLGKLLAIQHKVYPVSEDYLTLMGETIDGEIIEGEEQITSSHKKYKRIFYKEEPHVLKEVIDEIGNADLIILSMGSLITSLIPNLICPEIVEAINKSKAETMYICNFATQSGETDSFTVNDHVKLIENYLGKDSVDVVVVHDSPIDDYYIQKYKDEENKEIVRIDYDEIKNPHYKLIRHDLLTTEDGTLKHDTLKLSSVIFAYLMK